MRDPSSYVHQLLPAHDPEGKPILAVIAKRTYRLEQGRECAPAPEQPPLHPADRPYAGGDPLTSSCEFESDLVPYKPFIDFVVNANAHAPGGRPVREMTVAVEVGARRKTVDVIGNRTCRHRSSGAPEWTDPEPFTQMPLRYENAYGGVDVRSREDGGGLVYPRNPLGKGYVVEDHPQAINGLQLPNLEDPNQRLMPESLSVHEPSAWSGQPMPAGFGWYGKAWFPRALHVGVLPEYVAIRDEFHEVSLGYLAPGSVEAFKSLKMPLLNPRFFNGAALDLQLESLAPGERVRLSGMDPGGDVEFLLPTRGPRVRIDIGEGPQEPEPRLHTVCISKEVGSLYLVWRAAIAYPGPERMHELPKLEISVEES
jgi:hypothetical protein